MGIIYWRQVITVNTSKCSVCVYVCVSLQSPQPSLSSQVDPFKTQWRITFSSGHWLQPAQKNTKALILPWHTVCLCLRQCVFSYFMLATQVAAYDCKSTSVCVYACDVSVCAGGSGLSSQGQVGGLRPLSSVEWLWIGFGSGLNLLTDTSWFFSARPEKRLLSLKPHTAHPIHCDLSQSLAKMQV